MFIPFLSNLSKQNIEYSIDALYPVYNRTKDESLFINNINLFINAFTIDFDSQLVLKLIEMVYHFRESWDDSNLNTILKGFYSTAFLRPEFSIELMISNWSDFHNYELKYNSIKCLLNTEIIKQKTKIRSLIDKMKDDIKDANYETLKEYFNEAENYFKDSQIERTFFADFLRGSKKIIRSEFKEKIRKEKIEEIKLESHIDICRNKFSIIIQFKSNEYEKDGKINDLFFSLLNDSIEKKRLALDVFDLYYEGKNPLNRKGELTDRLNNLVKEMDNNYQKKIYELSNKYGLKVKKGIFKSIFGG